MEAVGGGVGRGLIVGSPGVVNGFVNELAGIARKADAGGTGGAEVGTGGSGGNGVIVPPMPCSGSMTCEETFVRNVNLPIDKNLSLFDCWTICSG